MRAGGTGLMSTTYEAALASEPWFAGEREAQA
jgi:hypothetical protein